MPNLGLKKESIAVEKLPTAEIAVVRCCSQVPATAEFCSLDD